MKKGVKALIVFFVIVIVAGIVLILIQDPLVIKDFFSQINFNNIKEWFEGLGRNSLIFLGAGILFVVLIIFFSVYMRKKKKKKESKLKKKKKRIENKIKKKKGISTKLDLLYSELKDKKETTVSDFSEKLGISKDKGLDRKSVV